VKALRKNVAVILFIFIFLFVSLMGYMGYALSRYGSRWFVNPYNPRLQNEKKNVIAGDILDCKGIKLASTNADGDRVYGPDKATRKAMSHVVGDNYGLTSTGMETLMAGKLLGFESSAYSRLTQQISGEKIRGDSIQLTVDSALQSFIASKVGSRKGAVVLLNYKTGEILSLFSNPVFDPSHMEKFLDQPVKPKVATEEDDTNTVGDTALFNRALMGRYPPGSTFKVITAAAMLRSDPNAETETWTCDGELAVDDAVITESGGAVHGTVDLKKALTESCNVAFSQMGMTLGAGRLLNMAEAFGFNDEFLFKDIILYSSSFEGASSQRDLAWSAIGQYTDLASPMHMAMVAASIANDGVMMEPEIVARTIDPAGNATPTLAPRQYARPLSVEEARKLQTMMVSVVKSGTGSAASVSKLKVGGKTGTAETDKEGEAPHAWFIGFILDDAHPLAIAVLLENTGSGGKYAAPIAGDVLEKAVKLGY
jgi:penicillin-binding protein A